MTKLSDTQCILLSAASQRENGSILPLSTTLANNGGTMKAVGALINRGLAEQRETCDATEVHRVDGDTRWGVFITTAGAAAIGVELTDAAEETAAPASMTRTVAKGPTKTAAVIGLLIRPDGVTLAELIEATGWLPHTTRAALTGIRKKGHAVERGKRGDVSCYRILGAA